MAWFPRRRTLRAGLRLPPRTVRFRLTLLYGSGFLIAGIGLPAIVYLLYEHARTTFDVSVGSTAGRSAVENLRAMGSPSGWFRGPTVHPANGLLIQFGIALTILALVAALSYAFGWLVAGRVLRPLRIMKDTTRQISEHNLHARLAVQGPDDELKDLADTIDGLLARLEAAFDAQRRFIANAGHELRTPLTLQRSLLEVALANPDATVESLRLACERAVAAGEQHEHLVEALLTLATSQRGLDAWEPVDLADVAERVLRLRRPEAERRRIRVDAALAPASISGHANLVERLVGNLVENGLRYNMAGGRVEIVTGTQAGQATLAVRNTGPVVPADQIERMFQPFERLGDRRARHPEGHGLGLSIVESIVTAHGAELTADPRPDGGLRIEVRFPPVRVRAPSAPDHAAAGGASASTELAAKPRG